MAKRTKPLTKKQLRTEALKNHLARLGYTIISEEGNLWTLNDNKGTDEAVVIEVEPATRGQRASYTILQRCQVAS